MIYWKSSSEMVILKLPEGIPIFDDLPSLSTPQPLNSEAMDVDEVVKRSREILRRARGEALLSLSAPSMDWFNQWEIFRIQQMEVR